MTQKFLILGNGSCSQNAERKNSVKENFIKEIQENDHFIMVIFLFIISFVKLFGKKGLGTTT